MHAAIQNSVLIATRVVAPGDVGTPTDRCDEPARGAARPARDHHRERDVGPHFVRSGRVTERTGTRPLELLGRGRQRAHPQAGPVPLILHYDVVERAGAAL